MYVGYVSGMQKTNAQNNMQAIYMVQEEYKASSINNAYYGSGNDCSPSVAGNTSINTDLFGGKAQLDISDPKFYFCIASGAGSDGGFNIFTERTDGTDKMTLNANNKKEHW